MVSSLSTTAHVVSDCSLSWHSTGWLWYSSCSVNRETHWLRKSLQFDLEKYVWCDVSRDPCSVALLACVFVRTHLLSPMKTPWWLASEWTHHWTSQISVRKRREIAITLVFDFYFQTWRVLLCLFLCFLSSWRLYACQQNEKTKLF